MSDDFLSRWSRLKRESGKAPVADPKERPVPAQDGGAVKPAEGKAADAPAAPPPQPLPPVESLTFDSDFTAFMKPEVGEVLKRQALKTLFQDPRFNVMDGLDVYIDDFSKPDPLPDGWLDKMNLSRLGDYRPPAEEAPEPLAEAPESEEKEPQKEALATPAESVPSDTLEAPAMPPAVTESPRPE